ncbi:hypothetical protein ABT390_19820 [Streptomyces aurantiacus]|uniref:Uncharacterized protein n=1 Tax=Streptomyces aurantiacus JA 4570 TaxID=1286094 RepID=S3ZNL7_9ACTN|nr:hypothetical protein [Streptomyces aurantiacus]EPH39940.1 hypothetical protein STRAU_6998 [Streptomyces aurantiacus JA 4570]
MSAATITPASLGPGPRPSTGATALSDTHRPHRLGAALRAAKVFAGVAFGVTVLGEYAEEAGVRRR